MHCSERPIDMSDNHKDTVRDAAREVLADAVAHLRRLGLDSLAIRALLAELLLAQGGRHGR
ncbi:MAG: hypothetical protein MUF10_02655 [Thermoanaerobaculaceae bacterium]|jgi:uncharacterized protein (DUF934 family)|nr:hypothetical protein [Thermoanaerobaculaceae bacterium]